MTSRRGFLGFLFAAPIAAEDVLHNQRASISLPGNVGSGASQAVAMSAEESAAMRLISKMMSREEAKEFHGVFIPASIASKKSWSPAFKEREAMRLELERRHRRLSLQEIAYGDEGYASKLAKLYEMGLGVNK